MPSPRTPWASHPATATVVGILVSGLTVLLAESAGHALLGAGDPRAAGGITTPQYLAVLVAWVLGAALGALVATRWARGRSAVPGVVVGAFVLLGAAASFAALPHPAWMVLASGTLPLVGLAAARVAAGRAR